MRKTKIAFIGLMILLSLYFAYSYVFVPVFDLGQTPSMFNIIFKMFTKEDFATAIDVVKGTKTDYSCGVQVYFLVQATFFILFFINIIIKYFHVLYNKHIQKSNIFGLIYLSVGVVSNIMILGSKFTATTYTIIISGDTSSYVDPIVHIVEFTDLPYTSVPYIQIGIYALLIILQLVLFAVCGKYGDISPIEFNDVKQKKNKKEKKEKKEKVSNPSRKFEDKKASEPKEEKDHKIFYNGPVPKSDDKIFIGLRDGDDVEVEPIGKKNTNENQPKEKVTFTKPKEEPKKEERISFTNYSKTNDNLDNENNENEANKNFSFYNKPQETFVSNSEENNKFDFKSFCLDSADEYYKDDDKDEDLEEEVPDLPNNK